MTTNPRSVNEVAAAVASGQITRIQGIARCDEVLARASLGKFRKAAWTALRAQLATKRTAHVANGDAAWKAAQAAMPKPQPKAAPKAAALPEDHAKLFAAFVTWMGQQ